MINIPKFIKSLGFALAGIISLIKSENNARIHLYATILVIFAGFYFNISTYDWCWITLAIALVWLSEAFNTAIETLCDFTSQDFNPKIKKIKDISAAGVLIAACFALFVAVRVFLF